MMRARRYLRNRGSLFLAVLTLVIAAATIATMHFWIILAALLRLFTGGIPFLLVLGVIWLPYMIVWAFWRFWGRAVERDHIAEIDHAPLGEGGGGYRASARAAHGPRRATRGVRDVEDACGMLWMMGALTLPVLADQIVNGKLARAVFVMMVTVEAAIFLACWGLLAICRSVWVNEHRRKWASGAAVVIVACTAVLVFVVAPGWNKFSSFGPVPWLFGPALPFTSVSWSSMLRVALGAYAALLFATSVAGVKEAWAQKKEAERRVS